MNLASQKCEPCEGNVKPMKRSEALRYFKYIKGWKLVKNTIEREYKFENFEKALEFVNKVGDIAEAEGHHPNIHIYDWNKVELVLTTHSIKGLSQNDFKMAAKINRLNI